MPETLSLDMGLEIVTTGAVLLEAAAGATNQLSMIMLQKLIVLQEVSMKAVYIPTHLLHSRSSFIEEFCLLDAKSYVKE